MTCGPSPRWSIDGRPRTLAAIVLALLLGSCAVGPPAQAPSLEPEAAAPVWPAPPDSPRFIFVRTLVGERDFIGPENETTDGVTDALKWIAGLIVGDPEYEELRRPVAGLVDRRGRIHVIDTSHRAVMVFDMPAARLLKWQLAAEDLLFVAPVGIAEDIDGGILVTDPELAEVFRLDADGRPLSRFGKGLLERPTGIARDPSSGLIYVADTAQHDIKVFNAAGKLVDLLGDRGRRGGTFNSPTHLAFAGGRLYVSDSLNFRVQVLDTEGDEQLVFGKVGLFVGNMTRPKGVAIGGGGRIYVVESYFDHLLVYNRTGELLLAIGGAGQDIGQFYLPAGAWTDRQGRVYVADMFNGRIVVLQELNEAALP